MEEKVKYMLEIIDEDGDSFAMRAEMYYRKRPEIINFVEESFRAYRALAERYDHISKELQSANRTIASVFPEQLHFAMDDDEENLPAMSAPSHDPNKPPKVLPAVPEKCFPKPPKLTRNFTKSFSRKGPPKKAVAAATATVISGLSKSEALEEIDKLQKGILSLQTEKEFLKGSCEIGLAKFWEIEKQITEMQAKVCSLQDEFGIGMVIEDDVARNLMAATALKACEDSLVKLREKQGQLAEEARVEYQKVKEAHAKFKTLGNELLGGGRDQQELSTDDETAHLGSAIPKLENLDQQGSIMERQDLEMLRQNIKEQLELNSASLNMTELAEKIDELVNQVISLETLVSTQNALVKRLTSETDELRAYIKTLEEGKEIPDEGSDSMSNKLRKLEEELHRVKNLYRSVEEQNCSLQTHFTEATCNLDHLSVKLQNVKPDAEVENLGLFQEARASTDAMLAPSIALLTSSSLKIEDEEKQSDASGLSSSIKIEEEGNITPSAQLNDEEHVCVLTPSNDLVTSDNMEMEDGEKQDDARDLIISTKVEEEENIAQPHPNDDLDLVSGVYRYVKREDEEKKDDAPVLGSSTEIEREENKILSNPFSELDFLSELNPKESGQVEKDEKQDYSPTAVNDPNSLPQDLGITEGDELNWRQLFLNGLNNREKILLQEYTTVLRNFKKIKKKLSEVEKENQDNNFESAMQIKELKNANDLKDKEIQSLRQGVSTSQTNPFENSKASLTESVQSQLEQPERIIRGASFRVSNVSSPAAGQWPLVDFLSESSVEFMKGTEESTSPGNMEISPSKGKENEIIRVKEDHAVSDIEEKFRSDIDLLLEDNLEFWLRFSSSFHEIEKFQTSTQDLQAEVAKLKDGSTKHNSIKSDARPIYNHLREIQTELTLWLDQNALLNDELKSRLSSLSSIQDEISRVSNAGSKAEETELNEYQAAKFQGEVLNMKQENKKVADELQAGLDHVRGLLIEIEKTLSKLDEDFGFSTPKQQHHHHHHFHVKHSFHALSRSRVPLRSFLFGVKLKKQKPSIFSCMNPALQKQYSDLSSGLPS